MLKITVEKSFRNLEKGWIYDFSDISTLKSITIVGENGCGKSSILQALRGTVNDPKNKSLYVSDYKNLSDNVVVEHGYERIFFLDGVMDNGKDFMNAYDAVALMNSGGFHAGKLSHGQGTLTYLARFIEENKNKIIPNKTLFVFDEADHGLSLEKQAKFTNVIDKFCFEMDCHCLVISHNPFFIQQSMVVYDFANRDYCESDDYIKKITGYSLKLAK